MDEQRRLIVDMYSDYADALSHYGRIAPVVCLRLASFAYRINEPVLGSFFVRIAWKFCSREDHENAYQYFEEDEK